MVDRVALLNVLPNRGSLPPTTSLEFHKLLDKAIALGIAELELRDARVLPGQARQELESALQDILAVGDLKKVARKWEPQRRIEDGTSPIRIADALVELLQGRREPYECPDMALEAAKQLPDSHKQVISQRIRELAPLPDLKKLAKKWDRENKALAADRGTLAAHLIALLDGSVTPAPKAQKAKK
jgi:hypothetical protein